MTATMRWTLADLEAFPDPLDDTRYEIIDGELFVSTQPNVAHQYTSGKVHRALDEWSEHSGAGTAIWAPGLIFADDDNVAPDVVWASNERLRLILREDGRLHDVPELVAEVLSPGSANERRDRQAKLKLYSRRGVHEYWIADWQQRRVDVYRRENAALHLVATLYVSDTLESPLLPGFSCPVARLFADLPHGPAWNGSDRAGG
jgi:Uma2 family endonuclease